MDVARFDFDLPADRIAQRPVRPRGRARMLVVREDRFEDCFIADLAMHLQSGDLILFNDTRVIPARLSGFRRAERGTAKIEITLNRPLDGGMWSAFAKPARRLRAGDDLDFRELDAAVVRIGEGGEVYLRFPMPNAELFVTLNRVGQTPTPPYLGRPADDADKTDYQTLFARTAGAVAAPTAGLHFDNSALASLTVRGVAWTFVTLHVGAGTFLPMDAGDTADHRMHPEWGEISEAAAALIEKTRTAGGRLVAVGTTVLRLMESAVDANGVIQPFRGETSLFLTPGHKFRTANMLLTNFHLPRSTLFMLTCAFAGTDRMHAAYRHAINTSGYRFYSYGDCCLLTR